MCYVMHWGCRLSRKKRYEGERFNVISVTKGGGQLSWRKVLRNTSMAPYDYQLNAEEYTNRYMHDYQLIWMNANWTQMNAT